MKKKKYDILPPAAIIILILIWQLLVMMWNIPDYLLPTPLDIILAFAASWKIILHHALITGMETLIGFAFSIVLGVIAGLAMSWSGIARRIMYPLFVISQTIPLIVLAPLLMVWLGFNITPKIIVVVLVCFFPIAVSFAEGLMKADPELDDLLKVMGASKAKRLLLSALPQSMPGLFSGLRITATYSVMGAVLAEWVGAKDGLGILMTRHMASFRTPELFADIVIIILMSLFLFKIVEKSEKIFIYWRRENEEF